MSRRFSGLFAAIFITSLGVGALPACADDAARASASCGGVVVDGVCHARCSDAECLAGNACVVTDAAPQGECARRCTASAECLVGKACVATTSQSGAAGSFCSSLGLPGDGAVGSVCTSAAACDTGHGIACVAGACAQAAVCADDAACAAGQRCEAANGAGACVTAPCRSSDECGAGKTCTNDGACVTTTCTDDDDCGPGKACTPGDAGVRSCTDLPACTADVPCPAGRHCRGVAGAAHAVCVAGAAAAGPGQYGTACPFQTECDKAAGFVCLGQKNDATAYCTKPGGCAADADCTTGYWCGGIATTDAQGNRVAAPDERACLRGGFCAPCVTDVDCSAEPGQVCVPDVHGEGFCSTLCSPGVNACDFGAACVDVGKGVDACRPTAGVCHPPAGAPAGCEPCRSDLDCGDKGFCLSGDQGYKPGVAFCAVPCGAPDAFGKRPCPRAPNGAEMVCLDENNVDPNLGGPFTATVDGKPFSLYDYCYAPWTVDTSAAFTGAAPPPATCGDFKRDPGEECDDGNNRDTDGCGADCKVTPACRFTVAEPNSVAVASVKTAGGAVLSEIVSFPTGDDPKGGEGCRTFALEGAIDTADDVDAVRFRVPATFDVVVDTYVGGLDECDGADLTAEVIPGSLPADVDESVTCGQLVAPISVYQAITETTTSAQLNALLCPSTGNGYVFRCGSCDAPGRCGSCDEDNGVGDCPHLNVSTVGAIALQDSNGNEVDVPIKYESADKFFRLSAHAGTKTPAPYLVVFQSLPHDFGGATEIAPAALACY